MDDAQPFQSDTPQKTPLSPIDRMRGQSDGDDPSDDVETVLWVGTYSGKTMVGSWVVAFMVSLGIIIGLLLAGWSGTMWMIGLVVIAVMWLYLGLVFAYRKLSRKYELSTQRFKHRSGIFTQMSDRIELIDIDDVTCRQGIVQAMLGVGTILIDSSDTSHPKLTLDGIDEVKRISDMIDDARRKERRKRGIHIEAV